MSDSSSRFRPDHPLWLFVAPHWRSIVFGSGVLMIDALLSLLLPLLGGRIVDHLTAAPAAGSLGRLILGIALFLTLQCALAVFGARVVASRTARISSVLRERTYGHLLSLPQSYLQERRMGEVLSLLANDVWCITRYLSHTLPAIGPAAVVGVGAMVSMLWIDRGLAIAALVSVPFFFLLLRVVGRSLRPLATQLQDAWAKLLGMEEEALRVFPLIKATASETRMRSEHAALQTRIVDLTQRREWRESSTGPMMTWLAGLGALAVVWVAGDRMASTHALSPSSLVTFLLYVALLTKPVGTASLLYGQSQQAFAAADRLHRLFAEPIERYAEAERALCITDGAIEFQRVDFSFPGRPPLFREFSFTVRGRETIAIVGDNGVGKSTLVSLLLRLQVPSSGTILIDGQDTSRCSLESVRRAIAWVSQEVHLINGTLRENITFAASKIDDAEVDRVVSVSQLGDFVQRLPNGLDTVIGDQGVRLSGGQRQRVALARALLSAAPVLVLDEATAMFDPAAEAKFLRECRAELRSRTVLLITHRPASLALADRVIRLGRGAERGPQPTWEQVPMVAAEGA